MIVTLETRWGAGAGDDDLGWRFGCEQESRRLELKAPRNARGKQTSKGWHAMR